MGVVAFKSSNGADRGPGVVAVGGRCIDLFNLKPGDFKIADIANALSQINRFGGRGAFPYTVAQHSVAVASHCTVEAWRPFYLLHDAAEAYIGDVVSPLKQRLLVTPPHPYTRMEFTLWEQQVRHHIFTDLGLQPPDGGEGLSMWFHIHEADKAELEREFFYQFPGQSAPSVEPVTLTPLGWDAARRLFLHACELCGISA